MESLRNGFNECRKLVLTYPRFSLFTGVLLFAYESGILKKTWQKIFVFFEVKFSKKYNRLLLVRKVELFRPLHQKVAECEATLKVVEIGLGGGSNFAFYPAGTEIIGVDPNPNYRRYLNKELKTEDGKKVQMVDFLCTGAEDMSALGEGSVDAVVATLVLCTVQDVAAVSSECLRILKPGGVFLFLHHNKADSERNPWISYFQELLNPVAKVLADGCHCNRDPIQEILDTGFAKVDYEKFLVPGKGFQWFEWSPTSLFRPHLIGCATK